MNINKDGHVAIVGIGFRIPGGKNENNTPITLWNNLVNGFNGIVESKSRWSDNYHDLGDISCGYAGLLPLDELKSFDPLFFGINPNDAQLIDPQQRLLLKCTWEALEDAMIDHKSIRGSNTTVYIGNTNMDYKDLNRNKMKQNVFGSLSHSISNRISYSYDLNGASMTIDTACSSSSNAIYLGYKSIVDNTSNLSIVGGVNLLLGIYTF